MAVAVVIHYVYTFQRKKKNMMQTKITHMPSITSTWATEALLILHASETLFEFSRWSLVLTLMFQKLEEKLCNQKQTNKKNLIKRKNYEI